MGVLLAAEAAQRYGSAHIRRTARTFLIGKIISAIAGIGLLFLFARYLSVSEFAIYSTLGGFIEMFTAFAGFGITHAILRYVPELYAKQRDTAMRRFVLGGMALRSFTLACAVGLVWLYVDPVTAFFRLSEWIYVFDMFLFLAFVRVSFYFVYQILESLLAQNIGQIGFTFSGVLKFLGVLVVVNIGYVDLVIVICIETFAEVAGLGIMLIGLTRMLTIAIADNEQLQSHWLGISWSRIWRYGLTGYLQHLAVLLYGSAPNRLVGARFLEASSMATLGFSQSLADVMGRYLPVQFFQGMIRPVLIARYSVNHDYRTLARQAGVLLRFNLLILAFPWVALVTAGEFMLAWITHDKYGVEANLLLIFLLIALALESGRFMLDIMTQAVERFDILLFTNLLLSFSLLTAIPLFSIFGAIAIPIANILGLLAANLVVIIWLSRAGFPTKPTWQPIIGLFVCIVVASIIGRLTTMQAGPFVALPIGMLLCAAMLWLLPPLTRDELVFITSFKRKP